MPNIGGQTGVDAQKENISDVNNGTENAPSAVDTGAEGKIRSSVRRARKLYPVAELCAG